MDNKWLLSEEEILQAIDKSTFVHSIQGSKSKSSYQYVAQAQLDHLIKLDWKSPEQVETIVNNASIKSFEAGENSTVVQDKLQDEHARTLKAVGKWLEKIIMTFSAWNFSGEPRMKIIRFIDTLKSGKELEGMK